MKKNILGLMLLINLYSLLWCMESSFNPEGQEKTDAALLAQQLEDIFIKEYGDCFKESMGMAEFKAFTQDIITRYNKSLKELAECKNNDQCKESLVTEIMLNKLNLEIIFMTLMSKCEGKSAKELKKFLA